MQKKALILTIFGFILFSGVLNAEQRMKMSTTTSTDNSGLLEALIPPFEKIFDIKVDIIAVGTGKALKLGENGDVDIVFVHARGAEDNIHITVFTKF